MPVFERYSRVINRWIERSLFFLGLTMALVVALQVFCRYLLNHSLFWSEELARYLMVWLTFLGASVAYCRGAHPGVDLFCAMLPDRLQRVGAVLVHLASLAMFAIMVVSGCRFAYFVRLQISPALYLPKWIIMGIVPISGLVLILHGLFFLTRTLRGPRHDR